MACTMDYCRQVEGGWQAGGRRLADRRKRAGRRKTAGSQKEEDFLWVKVPQVGHWSSLENRATGNSWAHQGELSKG